MIVSKLRLLGSDRRGSVAILFAASALPLLAAAGAAVDYSNLSRADARLSHAADAAALAGGKAMAVATALEEPEEQRKTAAEAATRDMLSAQAPEATALVTASVEESTVTVSLTDTEALHFMRVFGHETADVAARSVATFKPNEPVPCLLALDPDASQGIAIGGSGTVAGPKCSFWSNSASSDSINLTGSSTTEADRICAVGGRTGSASVSPTPETFCDAEPDPYADRSFTTNQACDYGAQNITASQTVTLEPGVHCGDFVLRGVVTLNPGLFVIRDGAFRINGSAQVIGEGVSFLLLGTSYLDWAGRAVIDLSAMTDGELAGLLIASDPNGPSLTSTLRGNVSPPLTASLVGSIYLPNQTLSMSGNSRVNVALGSGVIAGQFSLSGSSTLQLDYDDEAVRMQALSSLHLKE